MVTYLPLPLGEGRGEGLTSLKPFPSFPFPKGRGRIRSRINGKVFGGCLAVVPTGHLLHFKLESTNDE
jgi:hypothetical protein